MSPDSNISAINGVLLDSQQVGAPLDRNASNNPGEAIAYGLVPFLHKKRHIIIFIFSGHCLFLLGLFLSFQIQKDHTLVTYRYYKCIANRKKYLSNVQNDNFAILIYLLVTIVLKIVVFFRMVGGTWSKTHKHPSQVTPQNQIVLGWASLPFPVKFDYLFTCPWQLKGKEKGRTFSAFRRTYLFLTCLQKLLSSRLS